MDGADQKSLRLRIFAGPNGSGKSTIINAVREARENGRPLDFGYYINADDIAAKLAQGGFDVSSYNTPLNRASFVEFAEGSGLLNESFTSKDLQSCFTFSHSKIRPKRGERIEQLAQLIARYLREAMLAAGKRFSFETVFSHESNIDIMKRAVAQGYKVYLYFVATESPHLGLFLILKM